MLNKIRTRSILIAMLSITIVLVIILGGVSLVIMKSGRDYADGVLETIAENDGIFPIDYNGGTESRGYIGINPTDETPFDTRYFFVKFNSEGSVIKINTQNVNSVQNADAMIYANKALSKKKTSGNIDDYRYLVYDTNDGGKIVVFMDYTRQEATNTNVWRVGFLFGTTAFILAFLLLIVFSKRMLRPIEKSYEKQKSFISDASHELKTPMAIISANNELIEMDYGESESTRAIAKQITRMAGMTRNLTALSKIDNIDALAEKKKINVAGLIQDITEPYISIASSNNIDVSFDMDENVSIIGDESLMRQMVSLILDNAMKYGKSYIKVSLHEVKRKFRKEVDLEFRNDAENVENGNLDKYFDRFFRSDEVRASGIEGSGIGLSIVKQIAELHHGDISATGSGNEFFITIKFRCDKIKPIDIKYKVKKENSFLKHNKNK